MALDRSYRIVIASDIHYAGPLEQARGDYESRVIPNSIQRRLIHAYRKYIWLDRPQTHAVMLDRFLETAPDADAAVILGDLSCDSAFIGVADDAAFESTQICLQKLRRRFSNRVLVAIGDHDLGKTSLAGGAGGPRFASYQRITTELALEPFWHHTLGQVHLIGLTSTLVALPVFRPELLPEEIPLWEEARRAQIQQFRETLQRLPDNARWILCLHDPTALPFLAELPELQTRFSQLEATLIGHLHTPLILRLSHLLAGIPPIRFLGSAIRRMTTALRRARLWKPFRPRLCPSLTGIQLLKDGGFWTVTFPEDGSQFHWRFTPLPWPRKSPLATQPESPV